MTNNRSTSSTPRWFFVSPPIHFALTRTAFLFFFFFYHLSVTTVLAVAPCSNFELLQADSDPDQGALRMKVKFRSSYRQSSVSEYKLYEMTKFGNDLRKVSETPLATILPRKPRFPMEGGKSFANITVDFYRAGFASAYDIFRIVRDGAGEQATVFTGFDEGPPRGYSKNEDGFVKIWGPGTLQFIYLDIEAGIVENWDDCF